MSDDKTARARKALSIDPVIQQEIRDVMGVYMDRLHDVQVWLVLYRDGSKSANDNLNDATKAVVHGWRAPYRE
jgi:hypothetical protein